MLNPRDFELDYAKTDFNSNRIPKHPKSKEILYDYNLDTGTSVREGPILKANNITVRCIDRPDRTASIKCKYMSRTNNLNYNQSIEQLDSSMCRDPTGRGRSGGGRSGGGRSGGSHPSVRRTSCAVYEKTHI